MFEYLTLKDSGRYVCDPSSGKAMNPITLIVANGE